MIKDRDLIITAANLIRQADLCESASQFLKTAAPLVMSKDKLVRTTFHYLGIPIDGICLQIIDSLKGIVLESNLSDVKANF